MSVQPEIAAHYMQLVKQEYLLLDSCTVFVTNGKHLPDRAVVREGETCELLRSNGLRNYNLVVARGWESKSVEAQQAEAEEKQAPTRPPVTPEEAARCREKENLRLARQRVLQQMAASPNPRHRKLMQDSLADLEEKLRSLEK